MFDIDAVDWAHTIVDGCSWLVDCVVVVIDLVLEVVAEFLVEVVNAIGFLCLVWNVLNGIDEIEEEIFAKQNEYSLIFY